MRARRAARERLLQGLYQFQLTGEIGTLDELRTHFGDVESVVGPSVDWDFVEQLLGVLGRQMDEVDGLIRDASHHWRVERMAAVDLSLLRLATAELLAGVAPSRVVVNEAVELAKRYGTATSSTFVNGVLDGVLHRLRADPDRHPDVSDS
jgi:transcription antitermination protein NusB